MCFVVFNFTIIRSSCQFLHLRSAAQDWWRRKGLMLLLKPVPSARLWLNSNPGLVSWWAWWAGPLASRQSLFPFVLKALSDQRSPLLISTAIYSRLTFSSLFPSGRRSVCRFRWKVGLSGTKPVQLGIQYTEEAVADSRILMFIDLLET